MANDYKRMWTKEELEKLAPGSVEYTNDTGTSESSNIVIASPIIHAGIPETAYYQRKIREELQYIFEFDSNIDANINVSAECIFESNGEIFSEIYITSGYVYYVNGGKRVNARHRFAGWVKKYQTIHVTSSGFDKLKDYGTSTTYIRKSIHENVYQPIPINTTELEKAIPTDVSIIEDQGKLELMLEHDGNVLAINDTPNQFLQRRLDKPSAEWNKDTSPEDVETWLQGQLQNIYVWQYVAIRDGEVDDDIICHVVAKSTNSIGIKPIGVYTYNSEIINAYLIRFDTNNVNIYGIENSTTISFNDIQYIKLF